MFAAQTVEQHGFEPRIFSKKQKSFIFGAQYLHAAIPGLTDKDPATTIKTTRIGRQQLYAERVYGDVTRMTSWSKVQREQPAWDLRLAYDNAWAKFEPYIIDVEMDAESVADFSSKFELVISTVPLWSICDDDRHYFHSRPILFKQNILYPDLPGFKIPEKDSVVYNGTRVGDWYRASSIFGHSSIEARPTPWLAQSGWNLGFKIVDNTCDCHPNVVRAGRMGKWQAGELTHHAFATALDAITEFSGQRAKPV